MREREGPACTKGEREREPRVGRVVWGGPAMRASVRVGVPCGLWDG
jgi:hypothetical protein